MWPVARSHSRLLMLLGGLVICGAALLVGRALLSPAPKVPLVGYLWVPGVRTLAPAD